MTTIDQKLVGLKPIGINDSKCTTTTSLFQQILASSQERLNHQEKKCQWFNLGNSQTFNDPIAAARYLLEREYGETLDLNRKVSPYLRPYSCSSIPFGT